MERERGIKIYVRLTFVSPAMSRIELKIELQMNNDARHPTAPEVPDPVKSQ